MPARLYGRRRRVRNTCSCGCRLAMKVLISRTVTGQSGALARASTLAVNLDVRLPVPVGGGEVEVGDLKLRCFFRAGARVVKEQEDGVVPPTLCRELPLLCRSQ